MKPAPNKIEAAQAADFLQKTIAYHGAKLEAAEEKWKKDLRKRSYRQAMDALRIVNLYIKTLEAEK